MDVSRGLRALAVLAVGSFALTACGDPALDRDAYHAAQELGDVEPVKPVDVRKLIHPEADYLGLAYDGTIASGLERRDEFGELVDKPHNLLKYFEEFGGIFKIAENKKVWDEGALPFADVEPMEGTLKEFAEGKYDKDIRSYAVQVKKSNIPLAYSFGHEMNGWWYPWGYCSKKGEYETDGTAKEGDDIGKACIGESKNNKPEDFAAAWRHIHDIFTQVGAGNVIWVWSPNTARSEDMPALKRFYPGDEYVDWIGISGYMYEPKNKREKNPRIFQDVFGPTMVEIKKFTKKPFVIAETGSTATLRKKADVEKLFKGSYDHDDVLGFVWFNIHKVEFGEETDFRVEAQPNALAHYRRILQSQKFGPSFGFDPKQLINDN